MNTLIATDLDRTMIYSKGAIKAAPTNAAIRCVELDKGNAASHMTVDAANLLQDLASRVPLIPTTTRTIAQYKRIHLPGEPFRYAITSNGGNILVDGAPDHEWRSAVVDATNASGASLDDVSRDVHERISSDWVDKFRVADDMFCYLVVKLEALPPTFLAEWGQWCADHGWSASQQGRKIYAMPSTICKSRAVAEVRKRLIEEGELDSAARVIAAGDGALDAEMLMAADAAIRPRHGELEALNWQHPTVALTDKMGIEAGEEIVRWFAAQAA
ncbi:HAD family hydrolase [Antrihabitans sp. YC2-6]|uniref:HAD family hydrolase n=1 Tax=Antrihabitans sp. YC2-6 TaxID=2799498 RepID=UPI0018F3E979|nr:HAD family hydrolase [Antrihabitans sp. YC2-6]MBJ8347635.1 HAD family hydrolase [Antrihabitans sp. YC2-6]